MILTKLKCCAVTEVSDLYSQQTGLKAMREFCRNQKLHDGELRNPGTFILFTGVTNIKEGSHDYLVAAGKTKVGYGPSFAKYIQVHKLGKVISSDALPNKNHPTHTVKVWLWTPDFPAIKTWYKKYGTPKPRKDGKPIPFDGTGPAFYPGGPKGRWDTAQGVADGSYRCQHCNKTYIRGEKIYCVNGVFYCEPFGLAYEAQVKVVEGSRP